MDQPPRRDVIVLIDHRHIQFGGKSPSLFVIGAFIKRAGSAITVISGYFSFTALNIMVKRSAKISVIRSSLPIPINFRLKGLGCPASARFLPQTVFLASAIGIFYQIEHILYIGSHLFHRNAALLSHAAQFTFGMVAACTRILTRNPCRQYRNRLGTYIFAKLEIFEVT